MIKQNYIDVTDEWLRNAKPNSHKVKNLDYWLINNKKHKVDGKNIVLDYSNNELECATWLENTFGGEIYLCPRVNIPESIKTPDYIWNNEYWDLKEIKGTRKRLIDDIVKDCRYQANNLIIDINKSKITTKQIINQITNTFNNNSRKWIDTIILKNKNNLIIIYKRK